MPYSGLRILTVSLIHFFFSCTSSSLCWKPIVALHTHLCHPALDLASYCLNHLPLWFTALNLLISSPCPAFCPLGLYYWFQEIFFFKKKLLIPLLNLFFFSYYMSASSASSNAITALTFVQLISSRLSGLAFTFLFFPIANLAPHFKIYLVSLIFKNFWPPSSLPLFLLLSISAHWTKIPLIAP